MFAFIRRQIIVPRTFVNFSTSGLGGSLKSQTRFLGSRASVTSFASDASSASNRLLRFAVVTVPVVGGAVFLVRDKFSSEADSKSGISPSQDDSSSTHSGLPADVTSSVDAIAPARPARASDDDSREEEQEALQSPRAPTSARWLWWQLIVSEWRLFAPAVLAALSSTYISLRLARLVGTIIDLVRANNNGGAGSVASITLTSGPIAAAAGMLVAQAVLNLLYSALLSVAAERIASRLRARLFASLVRKDIATYDVSAVGEMMSGMTSDVQEVRSAIKHTFSMGVRAAAQAAGGVVSLFVLSPKLTGVLMVLMPAFIALGTVYARALQRLSKRVQAAEARASAVASEALSSIRTIRAYANESYAEQLYADKSRQHYALAKRMGIAVGSFQAFTTICLHGSILFVLLYGGQLVTSGQLTGGALATYMATSFQLQSSLQTLSILQGELVKGLSAASRIAETLAQMPRIPVSGGFRPTKADGVIEFRDVSFAYPSRPEPPVLSHVSFRLEPGKTYALVGPSGSGKTTVTALLERFYDPQVGSVRLDSTDIRELDPSWLRQQVAIVSQDVTMFSTSIADNIRFGRPDASEAEIENAAREANAHEFISQFPDGYATVVGERGCSLSGGQRQRISIARAILKDAKIVLLDEATSALDSQSEKLVHEALERLMHGKQRTCVVIAHRLSTVQNADVILVMKRGRIVETGPHAELMAIDNGVYRALVAKQLKI